MLQFISLANPRCLFLTEMNDKVWSCWLLKLCVQVSFPIVGASPDVHTFIQMKEKEEKKKTEESQDKRNFLAKYWMYILPVFLLLMMSMGGQ